MSPMSRRVSLLIACETGLIIAAVWLAAYVRFGSWMWNVMAEQNGMPKALLIAAVCQMCLYYSDLYDFRRSCDRNELLVRIIQALGAASFVLARCLLLVPRARSSAAACSSCAAGFVTVSSSGWRVAFEWLSSHVGPRASGCCSSAPARRRSSSRASCIERRQELGVEIVGFVDPDPHASACRVLNPGVIGTIEDIPAIVAKPRRRSRRRQPGRRPRQAADGQAARDEAGRRHVRPPRVGLRGVHRQDRRREPAAELADFLGRVPQDRALDARPSARSTSSRLRAACCWRRRSWLIVAAARAS